MLHLDLSLHPDDVARFLRLPDLARAAPNRAPRARPTPLRIVWHDTPDLALATAGLALAERRQSRETLWRLERMRPDDLALWAPGTPPPAIAQAADVEALGQALPAPLMPVAGFDGHVRTFGGEAVTVSVTTGVLRAVAGERAVCRVGLAGDVDAVGPLALGLAGSLRLCVPPTALSAEAYATARPPTLPRRLGAPALPRAISVGDAFAFVAAHLLDVILHFAPLAAGGIAPEPVHQMRVAMRRLRSAVKLFRKAVRCRELEAAEDELRQLARVLGPARDWDVFTSGSGRAVAAAFPGDPAVARLAKLATRKRDTSYAALRAYLASAEFRKLGLTLALLAASRPWEPPGTDALPPDPAPPDPTTSNVAPPDAMAGDAGRSNMQTTADLLTPADTQPPAETQVSSEAPSPATEAVARQAEALRLDITRYAARALNRRLARVLAPGDDIAALSAEDLHAIRLDAKRLRYAAEFFAPLFPGRDTRRFLRRVAALQERLGHLNDAAVAAGLLVEIGQAHSYAGGVVLGFVAAGGAGARRKIDRTWRKFCRQGPFWE